MRRLAVLAVLLLAGCAVTPEDTSMTRVARSLYHEQRPEYGRPVMNGTPDGKRQAEAAWKADIEACDPVADPKPRDPALSVSEFSRQYRLRLWDCLWAKGWRWDRDAPAVQAPAASAAPPAAPNASARPAMMIPPDGTTHVRFNETITHPAHGHPEHGNPASAALRADSWTAATGCRRTAHPPMTSPAPSTPASGPRAGAGSGIRERLPRLPDD